jgi:hypothetical protein
MVIALAVFIVLEILGSARADLAFGRSPFIKEKQFD